MKVASHLYWDLLYGIRFGSFASASSSSARTRRIQFRVSVPFDWPAVLGAAISMVGPGHGVSTRDGFEVSLTVIDMERRESAIESSSDSDYCGGQICFLAGAAGIWEVGGSP